MKLIICLLSILVVSSTELYRGYQLFRIDILDDDDAHFIHKLEEGHSGMLDFWTRTVSGRPMDVMVSADFIEEFADTLQRGQISYEILMKDVQDVIGKETAESRQARKGREEMKVNAIEDFDYSIYHTYDEIQQWTRDIAAEYDFVTLFTFGYTFEGREILALEISAPGEPGASDPKPVVYFEGGIHSREWISPATIIYLTGKLLRLYKEGDLDAIKTLGTFDLHIVPLLNCDGYVYTWTNIVPTGNESYHGVIGMLDWIFNRLWRTSRKHNPDFGCVGTDLNRNFDAFWGGEGASPWPCSLLFRGFTDFDNVETQAVDNHFQKLRENNRVTKVFIDWHSYSQLILAPWAYSGDVDPPIDTDKQIAAAGAMAKAMNETNNVPGGYIHGVGTDILYVSSGASEDYGYASTPQATYSYTVELRDTGQYGFLLPADQIIPSGNESYYGVIAMLDWIFVNDYD